MFANKMVLCVYTLWPFNIYAHYNFTTWNLFIISVMNVVLYRITWCFILLSNVCYASDFPTMCANHQNLESEKCIICSVRYIYLLTKWSGYLCLKIGCKHSRADEFVTFSKKDMFIAVFLCFSLLFSLGESIMSLIYKSYDNNSMFYRLLFLTVTDIEIFLCVFLFLLQIKIAKNALTQLFEILTDSTSFGIKEYFSKKHIVTYTNKSLLFCLAIVSSITIIIFLYRVNGGEPNISFTQEISLYFICYYYLSYSVASCMSIDLYCLIMTSFEDHTKKLIFEAIRTNNNTNVEHHISRFKKMSRFYLKVYFCFQEFIRYYNPNIILFMLGLSLCFLFCMLTFSFYLIEGKIDYFSLLLITIITIYTTSLLFIADNLMKQASINKFCFFLITNEWFGFIDV